ncbi:hypothetical protein, partial [Sphingomonas sp. 10B4]
ADAGAAAEFLSASPSIAEMRSSLQLSASRFAPDRHNMQTASLDGYISMQRNDVILLRINQNHYRYLGEQAWCDVPADGDCFYRALLRGLG